MEGKALDRNREMARRYMSFLCHSGNMVAVKLLKSVEEAKEIRRPDRKITLCQLIAERRYYGGTRVAVAEDLDCCYAVPRMLGFAELPEKSEERYVGWQFTTKEAAKKTIDSIPAFELGEYNAVLLSPWESCPVSPDVVILFGNAAQMLVVINAYLYNKGGTLSFTAGVGFACGLAIVSPMKEGKPNLILPGNGTRMMALPSETDLICGIPGESLQEILDGMEFTIPRGGSRYPPLWEHIHMEPAPFAAGVIRREDAGALWLRR